MKHSIQAPNFFFKHYKYINLQICQKKKELGLQPIEILIKLSIASKISEPARPLQTGETTRPQPFDT